MADVLSGEPKDPIDAYDSQHGNPASKPDRPSLSDNDAWGSNLNPVRETPLAGSGLKSVG